MMKWQTKKKTKKLKMKKAVFLLFGIILILTFLNLISAVTQPTQQFSKLFLNPFYTQSTTQNVNNTFSITINSPDGIGFVNSAIINFDVWLNPSVTFRLWVNNKPCNNPIYYVSTTYASAGKNTISFDCSNVITKLGNYQIILKSDKDTGAVTGWLDLAYMTNPVGEIVVHGTEYTYGQTAKVWLQLLNNSGVALTNAVCYADIYTPTGEEYIEKAVMTNMQHDGIYYYDIEILGMEQGVYPVIATCYYEVGQTNNFPTSITMINGTLNAGTISNVQVLDTIYLTTTESPAGSGNPRRINTQWNFSSSKICNVSEELLTGVSISWTGKWNSNLANDVLTFQIYNYTSSQWINLSNTITGSGTSVKVVSNSFSFNNITKAGLVNASGGNLLLRIYDTSLADSTSSGFDTDFLSFQCNQLSNPQWQQVKGSSEIHITSEFDFQIEFPENSYSINDTYSVTLWNGTNITNDYYVGIFKHQFSLASSIAIPKNNILVEYQGFHSIPCNSILDLFFVNATGYYPYPFLVQRQTEEDHCSINFLVNLTEGQNYQFEVYARNVWESDIRSTHSGIGAIYPLLNAGCLLWQIGKSYPAYVVPKNQSNEIYDYYYRSCGNFYDGYYWFNQVYNKTSVDKLLIVDEQTYLQYEADYTSLVFSANKLNFISNSLLNNLQAVSDYSKLILDNPLGALTNLSDQKIWAGYSTMYQNWALLNASCGTGVCNVNATQIWAFSNRTLTAFTFDLTPNVNTTELSFQIWNFASRNLTFTLDSANYTLINQLINNRTDIVNYTHINQLINNRNDIINYTLINELLYNMNITDVTNYTLINQLINNRNDIVNYTKIYELIENQTRYDMTNYTHIGFSVWNWVGTISNNIISAFTNAIIQPVASAVWSFTSRNLTYTEDVTNYSKVAEFVWLYENKSLTFYQVNNISVEGIWGYMNRSLSFYPDAPEINYSLIAEYNWNYVSRNLTFENIGNNISIADIWNYYNRSLSDNLPLQIWNYPNRNLTTDLPFEIWNYQNRSLTYYTINLTELIEMINAYDFTQTPIPYDDTTGIIDTNHELNVTLMVQK